MGHHHGQSEAEQMALLEYLVDHNKHHTEELESLRSLPGAKEALDTAIEAYRQGNAALESYLRDHKKEA